MDVGSINPTQQTAVSQSAGLEQGTVTTRKNELGMDDFFKLLTTQLVSQDPLQPMQNTEFISQMANFSSLAQMEAMAASLETIQTQQDTLARTSLIGRYVRAETSEGAEIAGVVTKVVQDNGELIPYEGDVPVAYTSIMEFSQRDASPSAGESNPENSLTPAEDQATQPGV